MRSLEISFNGKKIKVVGQTVTYPSGVTVKMSKALGMVARIMGWLEMDPTLAGQRYVDGRLACLGLTRDDVEAVRASDEPMAKQLSSGKRDVVRCSRCNRVLWDAESIGLGMGPECRKR